MPRTSKGVRRAAKERMSRNYARLTSKTKDKRFKGTRTAELARKSVKGEVRLGPKSGKIKRVPTKTKRKHKRKYPLDYA